MTTYIILCLVIGGGYLLYQYINREHAAQSAGAAQRVPMGTLLADLPGQGVVPDVECGLGRDGLVILDHSGVLGEIPLDAVEHFGIVDKSTYASRVTLTRLAFLGLLALAVPKRSREQDYVLVIAWTDKTGLPRETAFGFQGSGAQDRAAKALAEVQDYVALYRGINWKKG